MNLYAYLRALITNNNDEGQDLLEYALLVALIAIVCVAAVTTTGTSVSAIFTAITGKLTAAAPVTP